MKDFYSNFPFLMKWGLLSSIVGILSGSLSALFLHSLHWVTDFREANPWLLFLLPISGLLIGISYHYLGSNVVKGNNQLIEEFHKPSKIIPIRMIPLILFGTLLTHIVGGSAGREGTAVQMGGASADQLTKIFQFNKLDRKTLLISGVSAGFASVFGTPLAGTIFALEVFTIGWIRAESIFPALISAIIGDQICQLWSVHHTSYSIPYIPRLTFSTIIFAILSGILFGIIAKLFSILVHRIQDLFQKKISYPPLRPFVGGLILLPILFFFGNRYAGLGVPIIQSAFVQELPFYDSIAKLLLTTFTLGAGFKGGEVTPLFFIGSTLGNFLSQIFPLPFPLLAGMGFVAVFAGATNTPIASFIMGMEIFGKEGGVYFFLACIVSYYFSSHNGIYSSQIVGTPKSTHSLIHWGKTLAEIRSDQKKS